MAVRLAPSGTWCVVLVSCCFCLLSNSLSLSLLYFLPQFSIFQFLFSTYSTCLSAFFLSAPFFLSVYISSSLPCCPLSLYPSPSSLPLLLSSLLLSPSYLSLFFLPVSLSLPVYLFLLSVFISLSLSSLSL